MIAVLLRAVTQAESQSPATQTAEGPLADGDPLPAADSLAPAIDRLGESLGHDSGLWVLFGVVGLLVAGLGASTSTALLAYSPTRLTRSPAGRKVQESLDLHGDGFQVLARVLMVGGLLVGGGSLGVAGSFGPTGAVAAVLAALLGCGVLPAMLADQRAEVALQRQIPWLAPLRRLLHLPLLLPLLTLGRWLLLPLRLRHKSIEEPEDVAQEILTAVSDSAMETELPDEERHWIENIVDLKTMDASGVMTPRTDVIALPCDLPIVAATQRALDAGFSRFPVYRDSVDQIAGVFYAKDALRMICSAGEGDAEVVGDLLRDAAFVPETMSLVDLLRHFRITKKQMAIVTDEYGGTSGVVTLEDVLEEIVGDIEDEYDPESEQPLHVIEAGRVFEISGRLRIDEANEELADRLPEEDDYDTLAGWVFTRLERVPQIGERFDLDGIGVEILAADDRRIDRLRIELPADPDAAAEQDPPAPRSNSESAREEQPR